MLHGSERDCFELSFSVPSECADKVASGVADIGIIPAAEIQRLQLPYFRDVGIACEGPVRTILLISKTRPEQIRTLAADSSSRTSVMLTRIVLARRFGAKPEIRTLAPDLGEMLEQCDAALIIGDPALRIEPNLLPYHVLDLGQEWTAMTELPMVFALWSGPEAFMTDANRQIFRDSCGFGLANLDQIVRISAAERNFPEELVRAYLTRHIVFELDDRHVRGVELFFRLAGELR